MVYIVEEREEPLKQKVFKCDECGCTFVTDIYSKDFSNLESTDVVYKSNCPKCLSSSSEKID